MQSQAREVVEKLKELNYFEYVPQNRLDFVLNDFIKNIDLNYELPGVWDEDENNQNMKDLCHRVHWYDTDFIFRQTGLSSIIENLLPSFEKYEFIFEVKEIYEHWDEENNWANQRITINQTNYTILKNYDELGWGETAQRFAQIVNLELEKQGKNLRAYIAMGWNDGQIVFLTDQLFEYITNTYENIYRRPTKIEEWARLNQVPQLDYGLISVE